ncbi:MAG TPA: FtsX-like permease family protein, partial [Steroidobacteraceae bacterium]|nr:FtsX-like permease family protein [Steroidobacteraceae bacterium]
EQFIAQRDSTARIINLVAALAVGIATAGLIGMSIHMARRRRHEIGVRKTLGARSSQVTTLLLRDATKPVLLGNIIAWPLAYLATHEYISNYAHQVNFSPWPFALGLTLTLLVAIVAVSWQTLRAARLNPATVLRHE